VLIRKPMKCKIWKYELAGAQIVYAPANSSSSWTSNQPLHKHRSAWTHSISLTNIKYKRFRSLLWHGFWLAELPQVRYLGLFTCLFLVYVNRTTDRVRGFRVKLRLNSDRNWGDREVDMSVSVIVDVQNTLNCSLIDILGTDEQRRNYLPKLSTNMVSWWNHSIE